LNNFALASWAPATAAAAAMSTRRIIRLVGRPRAIILSIRAALAGVARPRRVKPPGQKLFGVVNQLSGRMCRACRNSRSVIEINSLNVMSVRHDARAANAAKKRELAGSKILGCQQAPQKSLRIAASIIWHDPGLVTSHSTPTAHCVQDDSSRRRRELSKPWLQS